MNFKDGNDLIFRSPGKMLLTGEYLVLHGAEALALPVRFGQSLRIRKLEGSPALSWKTLVNKKHWFEADYSIPELEIKNSNDGSTAEVIRTLLLNARHFNHAFLSEPRRVEATAELDYDIKWGLGSSSSLTVNIAKWAEIDHFSLHFKTFPGSGFDVASAFTGKPLIYFLKKQSPVYHEIDFNPAFRDKIRFVYLGKKKSSANAILNFEKMRRDNLRSEIKEISSITQQISKSTDILQFTESLRKHDRIISDLIHMKPLSDTIFRSFNGYAKYLGAWGGDFAMVVSNCSEDSVLSWLKNLDLNISFSYEEIISA